MPFFWGVLLGKDLMTRTAKLFSRGPSFFCGGCKHNIQGIQYNGILAAEIIIFPVFVFFTSSKLDPVIAAGSKRDDFGSNLWKTTLRSVESTHSFAFSSVYRRSPHLCRPSVFSHSHISLTICQNLIPGVKS